MQAAKYRGDRRFSVEEVSPPPAPADNEVQIHVAYCGICGTDLHVYHGHMDRRVGFDRVIGHEMSGTVVATGDRVDDLSVGDLAVVRPLLPCGTCPACRSGRAHICHNLNFVGLDSNGAFQEYWNVPSHIVHRLPASMDRQTASLVEPTAVACHAARRTRLAAGEDVVVIGGGPIGLLTALVARSRGARVALAEVSPFRRGFAEGLGLHLLPVEQAALVDEVMQWTGTKGADVVYEVTGAQAGAEIMTTIVAAGGRIGQVGVHAERRSIDLHRVFWREIELIGVRVYLPEDYEEAIALLAGEVIPARQLVTDITPLARINEAFATLAGDPTAIKNLIELAG